MSMYENISPFGNIKNKGKPLNSISRLGGRKWKDMMKICHHLLMLSLKLCNECCLVLIIQLNSKVRLILIHVIFNRVEAAVIDHGWLLYLCTKEAYLCKYINPIVLTLLFLFYIGLLLSIFFH